LPHSAGFEIQPTQMRTEIDEISRLFSEFPCRWAFCGGWALDLFLDRQTRAHKDVDVVILRRDQLALQTYLRSQEWDLQIACNETLTRWRDGQFLEAPLHSIWCRRTPADQRLLEILLNESDGKRLYFRRNASIVLEHGAAFIRSRSGYPLVCPQLVLLYKSKTPSKIDNADFQNVLPVLDRTGRTWLKESIEAMYGSEHPWMPQLANPLGPEV
jgi:hypothetical protein